jgi:hypothetical protein
MMLQMGKDCCADVLMMERNQCWDEEEKETGTWESANC